MPVECFILPRPRAQKRRALKKEDQIYGQKLAEMVKKHSSEAFYAFDDPLEAAIFSVLVEMMKDRAREERNCDDSHTV